MAHSRHFAALREFGRYRGILLKKVLSGIADIDQTAPTKVNL